jgi:hypothetical protein
MTDMGRPPQAHPLFRKLALGMAVICLGLAVLFGFTADDLKGWTVGVCLFLAFVMLTIGRTGTWPPRSERRG